MSPGVGLERYVYDSKAARLWKGFRSHTPPLLQIRTELEHRAGCSLEDYKEFIDNEMLLIMAQMDRPSRIFDHLYLVRRYN